MVGIQRFDSFVHPGADISLHADVLIEFKALVVFRIGHDQLSGLKIVLGRVRNIFGVLNASGKVFLRIMFVITLWRTHVVNALDHGREIARFAHLDAVRTNRTFSSTVQKRFRSVRTFASSTSTACPLLTDSFTDSPATTFR